MTSDSHANMKITQQRPCTDQRDPEPKLSGEVTPHRTVRTDMRRSLRDHSAIDDISWQVEQLVDTSSVLESDRLWTEGSTMTEDCVFQLNARELKVDEWEQPLPTPSESNCNSSLTTRSGNSVMKSR